jgi:uncharacterized protein (TIGR02145 family)
MNFKISSFHHGQTERPLSCFRLITALIISLLTLIVTGCDKDDNKQPPTIPVVTTAALTNITSSGATGGGSIVSDGGDAITASGIVWSKTNATPTLVDSVIAGTTATGTFTSTISGLDFNTQYYIRAFATNSIGTGYGEVVTLNTTNDTNKVRFTYNGEEVVYGIIVSPTTGKKWLDRNLGAQQVANSKDDYLAYGDLFQWGRPADGHQLITWTSSTAGTPVNGLTAILATSDEPGHSDFIDGTGSDAADWRSDANRNRWNTVPQGPCPDGWHVPTNDEWKAEVSDTQYGGTASSGGMTDNTSAYNLLKLPVAGLRKSSGSSVGNLSQTGVNGVYWSSSDRVNPFNPSLTEAFTVSFLVNAVELSPYEKALGASVRCIKD